jgi:hypothetical protein
MVSAICIEKRKGKQNDDTHIYLSQTSINADMLK